MKCAKVSKNLSAYVDGELGERLRRSVSEHLKTCEKCALQLSRLEEVARVTKASLQVLTSAKTSPAHMREQVIRGTQPLVAHRPLMIPVAQFALVLTIVALISGLLVGIVQGARFSAKRTALRREIAEQSRGLVGTVKESEETRTQLLAAQARLSEVEEKLRLASARKGLTGADAETPSTRPWRPVLCSLHVPGAESILKNGLF